MTRYQVETLIRAHYARDEQRFETTVRQMASTMSESACAVILRLIGTGANQKARELLPLSAQSVLSPIEPVDLSDLVMQECQRAAVADVIEEHRRADALLAHGLWPRSRLLFWGESGNGKTSCAGAIAKALGRNAYVMQISAVMGSYLGDSSKRIRDALSALTGGLVVVIDEIDAIGTARMLGKDGASKEWNSVISALLAELDTRRDGILVGTTNRPDMLDPALRRRFDLELEFLPPDESTASSLIRKLWADYRMPDDASPNFRYEPSYDAIAKMVAREARKRILAVTP